MPDLCAKCGNEPRQGSHPWGKACRADYRKRGKTTPVTAVTNGNDRGNAVTESGNGNAAVTELPGGADSCALCLMRLDDIKSLEAALRELGQKYTADVQVFEEQIAGLKELLKGKEAMIARLTAGRPENQAPPKKGLGGQYTPHGPSCQGICCRHARALEPA